jgi:uncharacterized membrane protein YeaQ/YmgE (transglycosylase-associated protein family)
VDAEMGILSWIIVGLIAGWLAGLVMRGSGFGVIGDIIIGIIGGVIGGWLATSLFNIAGGVSGINLSSILTAFLGAVILIFIVQVLRGSRV